MKVFGSRNQRLLRQYQKLVMQISAMEAELESLSDDELRSKSQQFKQRLADGAELESLLPEAFSVVREASKRTLRLRHFDVQLIGGMVLYEGNIAEMRTGEGKTLVATLPAYVNALAGIPVHIVTVNDYLARRDANWMRPVYEFLGLSVGIIHTGQSREDKYEAYQADITYGTNNEFGFDYLRDNLAQQKQDQMQRGLGFAIVDEVDSILIDEARTPLIISGASDESSDLYIKINNLIPKLELEEDEEHPGDYTIEEKTKQAFLTERGHETVEKLLAKAGLIGRDESLYDAANIRLIHHITGGLRAHALYKVDVEYVVQNGEIVIVDEFTGRTMPGRRWGDGLHQAVEAKEGVVVNEENQTVASITFQNYFRMYQSLSGMTGTADTEAFEFQQIYGLEVVVVPTHREMVRDDQHDLVFLTQQDKFNAIIEDIEDCQERGQPVLVGTTSIETSEYLSGLLKKDSIKHEVLNAKQHEREALIVENAGLPGAVTIATNMAGRGTDIVLGGNLEAEIKALGDDADADTVSGIEAAWKERHMAVLDAGGLHIVGTERHESRRIDNQLRGRSGRQGDAGSSRFYLSMEDNLMRIFGDPDRTKNMLTRVGMKDGEAIESKLLTRQIERAQRKVEAHHFDSRKSLLEYDDVANDQRSVIYQQRNELMEDEDLSDVIAGIREEVISDVIAEYVLAGSAVDDWDLGGLEQALKNDFGAIFDFATMVEQNDGIDEDKLRALILDKIDADYKFKVGEIGPETMRHFEKLVMLGRLDAQWKQHLASLDYLRQGIHLRGYAQKDPKKEYKREAFEMFGDTLDHVKKDVTGILIRAQLRSEEDVEVMEGRRAEEQRRKMEFRHAEAPSAMDGSGDGEAVPGAEAAQVQQVVREGRKIGRNETCPCGSGKKYKHCHGKLS
ncbi:MAG TPA: preprotein translocase subunit SecA [Gammaproteobacteria bacterium]|jgi:preprotein translocase subunit SecA|nr:preprotein translocase subunit SecA [Chromatiales bacterium]MCP4926843.1 preprotein translocase subunit SecA [Gammaproteobacteria bacterium]HJP37945.1 preprotein translocase subunit SecA [Gammaproteobacteria bacterium]